MIAQFFALIFFNIYYGTVFLDKAEFLYGFWTFSAICVWRFSLKITSPVGRTLGKIYDPLGKHCAMSSRVMDMVINHDKRITLFYAEICVDLLANT